MHDYIVVHVNFLGFWNFSRNRLAGDELPSGDASLSMQFWVLVEESPGGYPWPPGDTSHTTQFLGLLGTT